MKRRPEVAVGIAIGYLMGRNKRTRMAFMMAGAAATGALGDAPRRLLQQGTEKLTASPELTKITDGVRDELFTAAKGAAIAAVSNRLESFSDQLQERAVRPQAATEEPEAEAEEEEPEAEAEEEEEPEAEAEEEEEPEAEAEEEEEPEEEKEEEERPRARRRPAKKAAAKKRPVRRTRR